ncbi:endonuclease YncB(thermonuclease family) [Sinorhizobium kostiense]|uniref:Endonuclease YncB(Thermonuclease family) n=1 Tax=Sinorhizobium kostiense TaxID=76747 RepID=A0ABS4QXF1_9HYPH|nr:thermonuclease family protein [Sinorhizobium kostiense]MBP2235327.1 endonuclease YncB(thermonuclease family) [Sinorhizobium kostiense]
MKSKSIFAAALVVVSSVSTPVFARSARVVDGDTLEINGVTYRLHGIDAPEAGQSCEKAGGGKWACGKAAIAAMEDLISSGVTCDNRGSDGYSRTIGVCTAGGIDVNARMVEAGNAWAFVKYSTDYVSIEQKARAAGVGVWQAETESPWDYRAHKWDVAKQESPDGCPIKGNISKQGMIYHAPWSPWYGKTKVSQEEGERWFCSEGEAIQAGWRAPIWGN